MTRENNRFLAGTYKPVIVENMAMDDPCRYWDNNATKDGERIDLLTMFVHQAMENPARISYTPSPEYGETDRQVSVTAGVFLQRFFGHVLSSHDIDMAAAGYEESVAPAKLMFAATREDIARVYREGSPSCMGCNFMTDVHPCEAYAAGDLQVAYLVTATQIDSLGSLIKIQARVVTWPDKLIFNGSFYGHTQHFNNLLRDRLKESGYSESNSGFHGARLLKLECGSEYYMPYLDMASDVSDHGDHFRIGGDISARSTGGSINIRNYGDGERCDRCERMTRDTHSVEVDGDTEYWCEFCHEDTVCCQDGTSVPYDDAVSMERGEYYWTQAQFNENGATCEATDENIPLDESVTLHDGTVWSQSYFDSHGATCPHCDANYAT